VWRELVRVHLPAVAVYALLKLLLGMMAGLVVAMLTLCSCCILGLPYLSSVAFLPVGVFFRTYGLFFLEQLGPDWQLIQPAPTDRGPGEGDYQRWRASSE